MAFPKYDAESNSYIDYDPLNNEANSNLASSWNTSDRYGIYSLRRDTHWIAMVLLIDEWYSLIWARRLASIYWETNTEELVYTVGDTVTWILDRWNYAEFIQHFPPPSLAHIPKITDSWEEGLTLVFTDPIADEWKGIHSGEHINRKLELSLAD